MAQAAPQLTLCAPLAAAQLTNVLGAASFNALDPTREPAFLARVPHTYARASTTLYLLDPATGELPDNHAWEQYHRAILLYLVDHEVRESELFDNNPATPNRFHTISRNAENEANSPTPSPNYWQLSKKHKQAAVTQASLEVARKQHAIAAQEVHSAFSIGCEREVDNFVGITAQQYQSILQNHTLNVLQQVFLNYITRGTRQQEYTLIVSMLGHHGHRKKIDKVLDVTVIYKDFIIGLQQLNANGIDLIELLVDWLRYSCSWMMALSIVYRTLKPAARAHPDYKTLKARWFTAAANYPNRALLNVTELPVVPWTVRCTPAARPEQFNTRRRRYELRN